MTSVASFKKLPTGDPNLDRVQENVADLARQIPAASQPVIVTVSSDYKATGSEDVIHADAQSAPIRITLPKPSSSLKPLTVKQVNVTSTQPRPVTIATADGSKTIGGQASFVLDGTGTGSVSLTCDGRQFWPTVGSSTSSTSGTTYLPGDNIRIAGNVISADVPPGITPAQSAAIFSGLQPPFNPVAVFVASWGDDGNDGSSWFKAFRTTDPALSKLQGLGGGELHITDGATGNIWLRGDGLNVPGWHGDFPLRVIGYGRGITRSPFGIPAAVVNMGTNTGGGRFTPGIWLAGTFAPKEFFNLIPIFGGANQLIRQWDFRRDVAGNIVQTNIAAWTRSGTTATVALDLPAGFTITSASRTGSTVTVHFTVARLQLCTLRAGSIVRVTSTDVNFPSGDYGVTDGDGRTGSITYQDGLVRTTTGANIGTLQSHDLLPGDRIEVTSTLPNDVPAAPFKVRAIGPDAVTVTVSDPYGGKAINGSGNYPASGTWTDFGTWTLQDRFSFGSSLVDFYNVQGGPIAQAYDRPEAGPYVDLGSTADGFGIRFFSTACTGYVPTNDCYDPDRKCWLLSDPGGNVGGSMVVVYDARPAGAGIRMYGARQASWGVDCARILGDTPITLAAPPALEIVDGNAFGTVLLDNVQVADNPGSVPNVVVDAVGPASRAQDCGYVEGAITTINSGVAGDSRSAWVKGQPGIWGGPSGTQLAGDLPHVRRGLPIAMCRFKNLVVDPSGWELHGNTLTTGVKDPFGGTRAVRLSGSAGTFPYPQDSPTAIAVGDTWVYGTWVRHSGGWTTYSGGQIFVLTIINQLGQQQFAAQLFPSGFYFGDGEWQFLYGSSNVTDAPVGTSFSVRFSTPNPGTPGLEFYQPFLEQIPASLGWSDNEIAEYAGTVSTRARYLQPGMVGTLDGVPFIADGGVGVDSTLLTTPSGVTTPTKNLPLLAADGTVQGYIPVLPSNKNLPSGTVTASLIYNYNIAGFNGLMETNAGLFSGATQSYTTGTGPTIMSTSGSSTSTCEYGLNVPATTVTVRAHIVRNDLSGGTGLMEFIVTRNGAATSTILNVTEGAGGQDLVITGTIGGGATTDTYGLAFTNGTGATAGAFTGTVTLTVSAT